MNNVYLYNLCEGFPINDENTGAENEQQPHKRVRKMKDESLRGLSGAERIATIRANFPEEKKLAEKEKAKNRQRKQYALAKLGGILLSNQSVAPDFVNLLDDESKQIILQSPTKGNGRSKGVKSLNKALQNDKKPVKVFENAGYCEGCKETCGPHGCSELCECLNVNFVCCKHTDPSYNCPACYEKRVEDLQFTVCPEPFLLST
jgi:hypothetical protein